jgi:hypothetical protein
LRSTEGEELRWETLCDAQGRFLALDRRWPIGRMAESTSDRVVAPAELSGPLRLLAVLAARGVDARPEWRAMRKAIVAASGAGLALDVLVLTGQDEVSAEIEQDRVGALAAPELGGRARVVAETVPALRADFERRFDEFAPQVLHFFCHGSVSHGLAQLELATRADELQDSAVGSLRLQTDALTQVPALRAVWLVVLNCCRSAAGASELGSLAWMMVAAGAPAAIGMVEPVEALDAHAFCGGLYAELLPQLRESLLPGGGDRVIDWARMLQSPRSILSQRHDDQPEQHRQWALPVIYVRPEPFVVRRAAAPAAPAAAPPPAAPPNDQALALADLRRRVEEIAGLLRALPPDTPSAVRQQFVDLLEGVPLEMRPDLEGDFSLPEDGNGAP